MRSCIGCLNGCWWNTRLFGFSASHDRILFVISGLCSPALCHLGFDSISVPSNPVNSTISSGLSSVPKLFDSLIMSQCSVIKVCFPDIYLLSRWSLVRNNLHTVPASFIIPLPLLPSVTLFSFHADCGGHFSHRRDCDDDIRRWLSQSLGYWDHAGGRLCINVSSLQGEIIASM